MQIIIFTPYEKTINTNLTKLKEDFGTALTIVRCDNYPALTEALQFPENVQRILVAVFERTIDVLQFHAFLGKRDDISLYVITNNIQDEVLMSLRLLRPRFVLQNNDIPQLEEILHKSLSQYYDKSTRN